MRIGADFGGRRVTEGGHRVSVAEVGRNGHRIIAGQ